MTEEITLNGVVYVKKEDKPQEGAKPKKALRFPIERESTIIEELCGMFSTAVGEGVSEEHAVENGAAVIDPANVTLVSGKTEQARRVLARFIDAGEQRREMPAWEFLQADPKKKIQARYSMEYLGKIFAFFQATTSDAVCISMLPSHPIQIEDEHFVFILAPRIEQEDAA